MKKLLIGLLSLFFSLPVSAQDVTNEQILQDMKIKRRNVLSACAGNKPSDFTFHLGLYKACLDFERNSLIYIEYVEAHEVSKSWTELAEYKRHLNGFTSDMEAVLAALKDSTEELKRRNSEN